MKKTFTSIIALACIGLASLSQAAAQTKLVANYKDWSVYTVDKSGEKICFALSEPVDKSPKSVRHGDIFFMLSSWKSGVAVNQPNLKVGYTLRDEPNPVIRLNTDKWEMQVAGSDAFVEENSDEVRLVKAMRRGATMRVGATSNRGTSTSYKFSLSGVSAALDRVAKECQ